jgi:glycosyltransferase involved in cell wall biosynthesis
VKYLFVHQNFPGQYLHFVRHLLTDPANEVVFISEANQNTIPGVRRVAYQMPKPAQDEVHPNARDFDLGARRAEIVARTAANLQRLGFTPDIIIGHHGWGELLDLPDVWPDVPMLGYFEFYYRTEGQDVNFDPEFPVEPGRFARIRAMNAVNLLALSLDQQGQTPTRFQRTRYPDWAQKRIRVLPEGARLDLCKPDPAIMKRTLTVGDFKVGPREKLVTFVARNLEPYRGFHTMMRALPRILARTDTRVVMVGGNDVSYGARLANSTWREHFTRELNGRADLSRVLFPGQVPYEIYLKLLQRSNAHVYLTYPFVASWSLREALACGCAVVGADVEPVSEFITSGENGVLTPCLDPEALADRVLEVLEDKSLNRRIREGARRYAERHLDMDDHIRALEAAVREMVEGARVPVAAS